MNRLAGMPSFKSLSIRTQLACIGICGVVLTSLIIAGMYVLTSGLITQTNKDYTTSILSTIGDGIDANATTVNDILSNLSYSPVLHEFISETDPVGRVQLNRKIDLMVGNMMNLTEGILDFIYIGENGNVYGYNDKKAWVEKLRDRFPEMSKPYYSFLIREPLDNSRYLVVGSQIYSVDQANQFGTRIGYAALLIDVRALGLERGSLKIPDDISLYVLDRSDQILFTNTGTAIGEPFRLPEDWRTGASFEGRLDGRSYLFQVETLPGIQGKIVSLVPKKSLLTGTAAILKKISIIFIMAVLILSVPFILIIRNIVTPVNTLMKFIGAMKNNNINKFKARIEIEGNKEMTVLGQKLNSMLDQIDTLSIELVDTSTRLYRTELGKKKSELAFLRSQINPHFLYNTLESISGMALASGSEPIKEMTLGLAELFRYSIKGADEVKLQEELDAVNAYANIQKIRFGDRFDVVFDVDAEALRCRINRMTLQPLVENAVYHGLEPKLNKGLLRIACRVADDGYLHIVIADDGVGMPPQTLERALANIHDGETVDDDPGRSIGISNVVDRLFRTYGREVCIHIDSAENKGTTVSLRIPARRDDRDVSGAPGGR